MSSAMRSSRTWGQWGEPGYHPIRPIYPARWAVVTAYVAVIYLTIPFAPRLWASAQAFAGVSAESLAFYPLVAAGGAVALAVVLRTRLDAVILLALSALGATYYAIGRLLQTPAEKLHFLEYGLVPALIWWAWRPAPSGVSRQVVAVWLIAAAFGAGDELIQHYTAGRVGEVRDMLLNWQSAALGLAIVLLMVKREGALQDPS